MGVDHRPLRSRAPTPSRLLSAGRTAVGCRRDAEPTGWTWNIAGAGGRDQQVDLDAVAAGIQMLNVDLLAVQEVDRTLADSGRADSQRSSPRPWASAGSGPMPRPGRGRLPAPGRPRPGRSRLRQPAGVAAAPGRGGAAAVPLDRRRRAAHRAAGQHPGRRAPVTVAAPTCPTSRAPTCASCGSCSSWLGPEWRRGCWWAT